MCRVQLRFDDVDGFAELQPKRRQREPSKSRQVDDNNCDSYTKQDNVFGSGKEARGTEENCSSYRQQPLRRKWIFLYCVESPGRIIYATTILGAYAYVDLGNHYMLTEYPLNHVDTFL